MAKPALDADQVRQVFHYDAETGVFTWRITLGKGRAGRPAGNVNRDGYLDIGIYGRKYPAGRLAWLYVHGEWPKAQIDHMDGEKLNNRIANLRDVDARMNQENMRKARVDNVSKFLGVTACQDHFISRIKIKGRQIILGKFTTAEEAHETYLKAKREHHAGCTI